MQPVEIDVEANGVRLRCRDWAGAGPPIVLLHGLASNARIWDAMTPQLAGRHRVVAIDQRGHGLSGKPDGGYDFASVSGDLRAVLDRLEIERAIIVGHSWGGNVALAFGVTHPARVLGLVFVDGGFLDLRGTDGMSWEQVERELAPPDLTSMTMEELVANARHWNERNGWSPAAEATIRGSFRTAEDGTIRPQLSRENHMRILRSLWEQEPSLLYGALGRPALLVPAYTEAKGRWAEYQERKRRGVEAALAAIPDARAFVMEDTIHDVPLHRPDDLAAAILEFAMGL